MNNYNCIYLFICVIIKYTLEVKLLIIERINYNTYNIFI